MKTPICLDESIHSADDARKALDLGACRVINIKVSRVGGLLEAKRVHDVCRARGVPVWCGGMHEFGIGRAANVAIAALPGFTLPGDVSGSDKYYAEDIVEPPILADDGAIRVFEGPGLGVEPIEERIKARTLRTLTTHSHEGGTHGADGVHGMLRRAGRDDMLAPSRRACPPRIAQPRQAGARRSAGAPVRIACDRARRLGRGHRQRAGRRPRPRSIPRAGRIGARPWCWATSTRSGRSGTLERMPFRIEAVAPSARASTT